MKLLRVVGWGWIFLKFTKSRLLIYYKKGCEKGWLGGGGTFFLKFRKGGLLIYYKKGCEKISY